jgi:hypothetical protein
LEKWLVLMRILAQKLWTNVADFCSIPNYTNPTQHDPHGPDDPLRSLKYIILTHQDMMEWMSRILDGEMAGADEDFGSEIDE